MKFYYQITFIISWESLFLNFWVFFFFFSRSTQYALDATVVSYMFIFCAVHEKDAGQQSFESCFYKNPVAAGAIVPNPVVGWEMGSYHFFGSLACPLSSSVKGPNTWRYPFLIKGVLNDKLDYVWASARERICVPWICRECFSGLALEPLTWLGSHLMGQKISLHVKKWTAWPASINMLDAFELVHMLLLPL